MEDTIDLEAVYTEVEKVLPPDATHFTVTLASRHGCGLYRACDGMFIAECSDKTAIIGENPNKRESRLFINYGFARKYLLKLADKDVLDSGTSGAANVFDFDYERHLMEASNLIIPGGDGSLIVNGSMRIDGKMPTIRKLN